MPPAAGSFFSHGATLMIGTLLVLAIAYRYYSAFIAAKVLALDAGRPTPAHTLTDGQNYHPTNKWVLFGHHFAAISGAGPLIGPVMAAQYGFLPGFLWILIGVCLAGAVQDFVILGLSTRRNGKSLAQIAYGEIGPVAGTAATIGILFVLIIAIAGLGKVVTKALGGEEVVYAAGTQFIGEPTAAFSLFDRHDNTSIYRIPAGVHIQYPNGAVTTVAAQFELESTPLDVPYVVDLDAKDPRGPGLRLEVPANNRALRHISGSAWGTFTLAMTIPIALLVGAYMYRFRKGRVLEASIIGGVLTLVAVWAGGFIDRPETVIGAMRETFDLTGRQVGIAMAVYGFIAAVLPVWVLLCPRDYLSSFLKLGTIALLVLGVILANPVIHAPAFNEVFKNGGPSVPGAVFPFVFITIMCGAVSGFHALVSSGTTPKMLDKETDARTIGYGAMLMEGLVGIVALIAASSLPSATYYHIQTGMDKLPKYQQQIAQVVENDKVAQLDPEETPAAMEKAVGENLQGRTGGAVTLAVGMADIFDGAAKRILGKSAAAVGWVQSMIPYWYHFAIMFEALFILTTIDTGTRVGRFLLQETMGKWIHPKLGRTDWLPSTLLATALIVGGWFYFIDSKSMDAIWPMFGISNQMLSVMALGIASVTLVHVGKRRYVWVTLIPMIAVAITTGSAATVMVGGYFRNHTTNDLISAALILAIVTCTGIVLVGALLAAGRQPRNPSSGVRPEVPADPLAHNELGSLG
jgi:carbon starvation protein